MGITLTSSHVTGDFSAGRLDVELAVEDEAAGQTRYDTISFEVPSDFHTHHDSVAAALLTLVGRTSPVVRFNFPLSTSCATTLRAHYGLEEVGPVDPALAPRRRGTQLGLLLSGGMDSLGMWVLLRQMLGAEGFRTITIDFGGAFAYEAQGFGAVPRDVTCRTNFRQKGYWRSGRFTGSVPLLYADYLDLDRVVTGHHANHPPSDLEPPGPGAERRAPLFTLNDPPFEAGGLGELHLARALWAPSTPWILLHDHPALLEAGWHGSSTDGSVKRFKKGLVLRHLFERAGRTAPEWLRAPLLAPHHRQALVDEPETLGLSLYLVKHCGPEALAPLFRDIHRYDFGFLDDLRLTFLDRYIPSVVDYLPAQLRQPVRDAFAHFDIAPYDERDFAEQYQVGAMIARAREQRGGGAARYALE